MVGFLSKYLIIMTEIILPYKQKELLNIQIA